MTRYYTSDTHFGHVNIIELCERPFADVDEMNAAMIERWNSVVRPRDMVIHFGDVAMGKIADSLPLVGQLNGRKVLIPGNHDRIFSRMTQKQRDRFLPEYAKVFDIILEEQSQLRVGDEWVNACHFPYVGDSHGEDRYADMRPEDDGNVIVHGHVHEEWVQNGRQINVGVDVWDFMPVHEDQLEVLVREARLYPDRFVAKSGEVRPVRA
jgi:calcineurin-like phosphoesterase family protein